MRLIILSFLLLLPSMIFSQVGINTVAPSTAAQLHLEAKRFNTTTYGGYLMPIVTQAEEDMIPVTATDDGLMVYVSDASIGKHCWDVYDSTADIWRSINCLNLGNTVTPPPTAPDIALIKTGVFNDENNDGVAQSGETIGYIFRVFNTGNVPLSNITLTDALLGGVIAGPVSGDTNSDNILAINEVWVYTATYIINAGDVSNGFRTNQASVSGVDDSTSNSVSDQSDDNNVNENDQTIVILPADENCSDVLYTEDFETYAEGTGINGNGNSGDYPASVTKWTLSEIFPGNLLNADDYIEVRNGVLVSHDTNGPIEFLTQSIDITGYDNIRFSVDLYGDGELEYDPTEHDTDDTNDQNDYFNVEYSINGGAFTRIPNFNGEGTGNHTLVAFHISGNGNSAPFFPTETVTQDNLSGTSLQIRIQFQNWAGGEFLYIDNIVVECQ